MAQHPDAEAGRAPGDGAAGLTDKLKAKGLVVEE